MISSTVCKGAIRVNDVFCFFQEGTIWQYTLRVQSVNIAIILMMSRIFYANNKRVKLDWHNASADLFISIINAL